MKNFLHIRDITLKDLKKIISDAKKRKAKRKKLNTLDPDKDVPLKGKILLQMFEKSSLRTRLSFYLAIKQLGGGSLTLRPEELHLGIGSESIADTSKILSTYGNAFMLRTDSDKKLDEFKKYLTIPIINGLSPSSHPTQVLSDIFTIQEIKKKSISKLKLCWIGDANNNMMNSLIEACIKCDIDYLAIGILDIGIKSKVDNNQNREISVSVQSQVWNIQEKLPRVIAAVGPITSDANEKDDITTIKKALVDPADSVARNIVDQLNAKNIN